MIVGLPWTAWLLWIVAIGLGPAIQLPFYFRYRRRAAEDRSN